MSDTKLMSLEARPEREDYLNPATREEAPAEAGEPEALRMAYKTGYQEGVEDSDGNFCRDACEEGWGKYLEALRAQPQAREDAQPVQCHHEAYQGYCAHCGVKIVNGRAVTPKPHPAPGALRVAVEALKMIHAEVHALREEAGLVRVRAHRLNKWWSASGEALAALQAEQEGK